MVSPAVCHQVLSDRLQPHQITPLTSLHVSSSCRDPLHAREITTDRVTNQTWELWSAPRLPDRESATPAAYLAASGALFSLLGLTPTCGCVHVSVCFGAADWRPPVVLSRTGSAASSQACSGTCYTRSHVFGVSILFFFFFSQHHMTLVHCPATNSSSPSLLFIQSTSLTLPSPSLSFPPLSASLVCEYSLILFWLFAVITLSLPGIPQPPPPVLRPNNPSMSEKWLSRRAYVCACVCVGRLWNAEGLHMYCLWRRERCNQLLTGGTERSYPLFCLFGCTCASHKPWLIHCPSQCVNPNTQTCCDVRELLSVSCVT